MHINLIEMPIDIFKPTINLDNVQEMLTESQQNLTENAVKCKEFITLHMKSRKNIGPPNMAELMSFLNMNMESKLINGNDCCDDYANSMQCASKEKLLRHNDKPNAMKDGDNDNANCLPNESVLQQLPFGLDQCIDIAKLYFDSQIKEMEIRITSQIETELRAIEQRQNDKLDKIIKMLSDK